MHKFRRDGYHKLRMLSLSQIKSEDIDGAVRPKPIDRECVRLSRRHVISGASLFNDKWGRVPLLIEHFPTGMNRLGFPKRRESDSSWMLAREVSMHDQGAFR